MNRKNIKAIIVFIIIGILILDLAANVVLMTTTFIFSYFDSFWKALSHVLFDNALVIIIILICYLHHHGKK